MLQLQPKCYSEFLFQENPAVASLMVYTEIKEESNISLE